MANAICSVPDCTRGTPGGSGRYCSMHYRRLQRHGSLDKPARPSPEERFWSKVDKTDACWLWVASLWPNGYGSFFHSRPNRRALMAHRFAYELMVGPIPDGLDLDHLCRVRNCVNPAHLEPVTRRVNTLRGIGPAAVNATKTQCPSGHGYDNDNTSVDSRGHRHCRACHRDRERERSRQRPRKTARGAIKAESIRTGRCPQGHAYVGNNVGTKGQCRRCDVARTVEARRLREVADPSLKEARLERERQRYRRKLAAS